MTNFPSVICGFTQSYLINHIKENNSRIFVTEKNDKFNIYIYPMNTTNLHDNINSLISKCDILYELKNNEWTIVHTYPKY